MKKKLTPEQEELLSKFKGTGKSGQNHSSSEKNEKAQSNAPKPNIRRSGSRGK